VLVQARRMTGAGNKPKARGAASGKD